MHQRSIQLKQDTVTTPTRHNPHVEYSINGINQKYKFKVCFKGLCQKRKKKVQH